MGEVIDRLQTTALWDNATIVVVANRVIQSPTVTLRFRARSIANITSGSAGS